jgi:glycosyltransferase involved in cell wall biosynthesis
MFGANPEVDNFFVLDKTMTRTARETRTSYFGHEMPIRGGVSETPLVSVVISNYNYENFLKDAVDSALDQTYPNVEVVVVDDGSTDGSRATITSYGDRIVPVLKENGGQASACNAGFRASGGEIVTFLDADDVLLPDTLERVVAAFRSRPKVAKVQYRQRMVDARGKPTGELEPPARRPMPSGDLRKRLLELNEYIWPSTSGNAFAAEVLRRIMPIPEGLYRGIPDLHLCNLSAVFGEVISLRKPGTLYRVHGRNNFFDPARPVNLDLLRKVLLALEDNHMREKRLFGALYDVDTRTIGPRDMYFLCGRMVSLRLDPQGHPFGGETLWRLFVRGCGLSASFPDPEMPRSRKLLYLLWFAMMLLAPRPLAWSLAEMFFGTDNKGWLYTRLVSFLRKLR